MSAPRDVCEAPRPCSRPRVVSMSFVKWDCTAVLSVAEAGVLEDATDGRTALDVDSRSCFRFRFRRIVPAREYTHSIVLSWQRLHTGRTRLHETYVGDESLAGADSQSEGTTDCKVPTLRERQESHWQIQQCDWIRCIQTYCIR